jgi:hypothetical protein
LEKKATVKEYLTVQHEGNRSVNRKIDYYNLDVIISTGYRVKSKRGVQFRQWSNQVLKDYLLKGYSLNQQLIRTDAKLMEHDRQIGELKDKVDFFVRTALPPVEGIFFNGQIFDAHVFASDLIKSAKKSIILIDNYVDETTLLVMGKRNAGVNATVYTAKITAQLQLDLSRYNAQYPSIEIKEYKHAHDRFLILDESELSHIGASLKDLGKKLFAFSRMEVPAQMILKDLGTCS